VLMPNRIGIRKEDKNKWERRVPLVPDEIAGFVKEHGIDFTLEPFPNRAYTKEEYEAVGCSFDEDLTDCPVVLGIKEMPIEFFKPGLTYMFFAHVIKGQEENMPMLQKLMDLGCNLLDYEKITNDKGFRLVFFGKEAGQAGMIDTLWALGRRLDHEGIENPFSIVKQAIEFGNLDEADNAVEAAGNIISEKGVPDELHPMIFGFAGYGNVSQGAQGVLNNLPVIEITAEELLRPMLDQYKSKNHVYKVVFHEEDMVVQKETERDFNLQEYYNFPERYHGVFEAYVEHMTVLMNCIYWTEKYPRLVSKGLVKRLYGGAENKLKVIGDISIDVEGAVEVSVKATDSGNPIYVYDVDKEEAVDGVEGNGPVILAVDNLPCELPREASAHFSKALKPFVPSLANADFSVDFDKLEIDAPLKRSVILYHGKLTPDFEYISEYLDK